MGDHSGRDVAAILADGEWTYGPGLRRLMPVPAGPDGRCDPEYGGCLSEERAFGRELGDGAAMKCYSCNEAVCLCCGTAPAPLHGWICTPCGERNMAAETTDL